MKIKFLLKNISILLFVSATFLFGSSCFPKTVPAKVDITEDNFQAFSNGPLTGNDAMYKAARIQIDRELDGNIPSQDIVAKYKALAADSPQDALAQFRWAYAALCYAYQPHSFYDKGKALDGVAVALINAPYPDTYNYARIEFLALDRCFHYTSFSMPLTSVYHVGVKLLAINGNDPAVERVQAIRLIADFTPEKLSQSIALLNKAIAQDPKNSDNYGVLGAIHYEAYKKWKTKTEGEAAINAYQRYVDLADSSDDFRSQAIYLIKSTSERLERQHN